MNTIWPFLAGLSTGLMVGVFGTVLLGLLFLGRLIELGRRLREPPRRVVEPE